MIIKLLNDSVLSIFFGAVRSLRPGDESDDVNAALALEPLINASAESAEWRDYIRHQSPTRLKRGGKY